MAKLEHSEFFNPELKYHKLFYILKERSVGYYNLDPLPILPPLPEIEQTTGRHLLARVIGVVTYATAHSEFFREHFEKHLINLLPNPEELRTPEKLKEFLDKFQTPENFLSQLPVLTKTDLQNGYTVDGDKRFSRLFTRAPYGIDFNTGGTTDHSAGIIFEMDELKLVLNRMNELLKYVYRPGDIVAIASGQYPMWGGYNINAFMWPNLPYMRVLPIGGGASQKEIYNAFSEYKPTVIAGLASSILSMIEKLAEYPNFSRDLLEEVRIIQFAGMPMEEVARKTINDIIGHSPRYVSHYTGSESWCTALGIDPEYPQFLYVSNNAIIEVLNPQDFRPLPPGQNGVLAITRTNETLLPMIRYIIGDLGRVVPPDEYPLDKRKFPGARVIELAGRANPFEIIIAGLKTDAKELTAFIKNILGVGEAQIIQLYPNEYEIRVLSDQGRLSNLSDIQQEALARQILSEYFKYYPIDDQVGANDYFAKAGLKISIKAIESSTGFEHTRVGKIPPFIKKPNQLSI